MTTTVVEKAKKKKVKKTVKQSKQNKQVSPAFNVEALLEEELQAEEKPTATPSRLVEEVEEVQDEVEESGLGKETTEGPS